MSNPSNNTNPVDNYDVDHKILTEDWPGPSTLDSIGENNVTNESQESTSHFNEVLSNIHEVQRDKQKQEHKPNECRQQPGLLAPGRTYRSAFLDNAPEPNIGVYIQMNSMFTTLRSFCANENISLILIISCVFYWSSVYQPWCPTIYRRRKLVTDLVIA